MIREIYHILRLGKYFTGFVEGDPTRDGGSMDYKEFRQEFDRCVEFWHTERGYPKDTFTYIIKTYYEE